MDQVSTLILGPIGGAVAFGFGVGALSGYRFAYGALQKEITMLSDRITALETELRRERDLRLKMMERLMNADPFNE